MPAPKGGKWVACVLKVYYGRSKEVWTRECNGYLRAYLMARFAALWVDLKTPTGGRWDSMAIHWAIRKTNEETNEETNKEI